MKMTKLNTNQTERYHVQKMMGQRKQT
jgi:hypothetical protein